MDDPDEIRHPLLGFACLGPIDALAKLQTEAMRLGIYSEWFDIAPAEPALRIFISKGGAETEMQLLKSASGGEFGHIKLGLITTA